MVEATDGRGHRGQGERPLGLVDDRPRGQERRNELLMFRCLEGAGVIDFY